MRGREVCAGGGQPPGQQATGAVDIVGGQATRTPTARPPCAHLPPDHAVPAAPTWLITVAVELGILQAAKEEERQQPGERGPPLPRPPATARRLPPMQPRLRRSPPGAQQPAHGRADEEQLATGVDGGCQHGGVDGASQQGRHRRRRARRRTHDGRRHERGVGRGNAAATAWADASAAADTAAASAAACALPATAAAAAEPAAGKSAAAAAAAAARQEAAGQAGGSAQPAWRRQQS